MTTSTTRKRTSRQVHGVCNLCEAICGLELTSRRRPGHRRSAATGRPALARAHLPKGVALADSTTTPTGCAARTPRRRRARRRVGGDRLGRGVRPGRRRARRADQRARPGRGRRLPRQPERAQPRLADPRRRRWSRRCRTRNRFSATSVDQLPHQLVALPAVRPPAAAPGPRHRPHVVLPGLRRQPDGLATAR